ncbi:MAG: hypothetical protein ACJ761_02415 [Chloroflexota bacterium]
MTGPRDGAGGRSRLALGGVGRYAAPLLAVVGLVIVAIVTIQLLGGNLPLSGGSRGDGDVVGPDRTPAPSNVVVIDPGVKFPGSITYAKGGNIWVQAGKDARQVTSSGNDSMPSWAPDGRSIYYVTTVYERSEWFIDGSLRKYNLYYPNLMQVAADGSGRPEQLATGRYVRNARAWFYWIRQPTPSPDGRSLAVLSDQPDPQRSDTVLQFYDLRTKRYTRAPVGEVQPLGHQDPAWRRDGQVLLYVRNARDGARGAPAIYRYDTSTKKTSAVTGPGYLEPSFSPDGRYIAATQTSAFGTDVVILDATRGRVVLPLTKDGSSWGPVWSPAGDSIAFLRIEGQIVDLWMVKLDGTAPDWTVSKPIALTRVSGLEGASRPSWFIPPAELPPAPSSGPSQPASPSTTPAASGASAGP